MVDFVIIQQCTNKKLQKKKNCKNSELNKYDRGFEFQFDRYISCYLHFNR